MPTYLDIYDGFDHFDTARIAHKWTSNMGSAVVAGGRASTPCLEQSPGLFSSDYITRGITASATVQVGAALKFDTTNFAGSAEVRFYRAGSLQCRILASPNGHLYAYNQAGVLVATSGGVVQIGRWYYIEAAAEIANAGVMYARVDQVEALSVSGVDTMGGTADCDEVWIGCSTGANWHVQYWDDVWIKRGTGSCLVGLLGDRHVYTSLPDGNGTVHNWPISPDTGEADYEDVDENPPDDDTTYIYSNTAGQLSLFTFPALSIAAGEIAAVAVTVYDRKDDPAGLLLNAATLTGGNYYYGGDKTTNEDYRFNQTIWEVNPDTLGEWTIAERNAAEFGIRIKP